jgi:hypothetical protein
MVMRKLLLVSLAIAGVAASLLVPLQAQERVRSVSVGGTPRISAADAKRPVPRLPDGTVDLTGPWLDGGSNDDIERDGGLKPGELPLLPAMRTLRDNRRTQDEPYTACLPMSVPRHNPYPWKFAMSYTSKGLTHIYVLHETGDAGAHRVVYMDGRKHPVDPIPTWWGHSIGRFEKDTLVRRARHTAHGEAAHHRAVDAPELRNHDQRLHPGRPRSVFPSGPVEVHGYAHPPGPGLDGVHLPRGQ